MSTLAVLFEVPEAIEKGLASGVFKRIGGVIVESASKQVVAWLRDGSAIDTVMDVATGIPSPFSLILTAARTAFSLWDGKVTRDAIEGVSQQVQAVSQQVSFVTTVGSLTATGQLLNLTLSTATFYAMMRRLDKLSEEVAKLSEVVREEFARERDMRFRVALQAARDVFESNQSKQRDNAVRSAVDGLYEARENFLTDYQHAIANAPDRDQLLIAQHCLIRALYAEISRIRCYIATGDLELARRRLVEDLPLLEEKAHQLVKFWLGDHPAIFLHRDVAPANVDRFLQTQRWIHHDNPLTYNDDARVLFNVINDLRCDFWNASLMEDEYSDAFSKIARRPIKTFSQKIADLSNILMQAEAIIENHQRLIGFELELRSMPLSFDEWNKMVKEPDLEKHGIGIIVDQERLNNARIRLGGKFQQEI